MQKEAIRKIKVSLSDYEKKNHKERLEFVLSEVKKEMMLKPGIGRFEDYLNAFGLGGEVEDTVRDCLLELSVARNVIIHRNSVVDARALKLCPWLQCDHGKKLNISGAMMTSYVLATGRYIVTLQMRVLKHFSEDFSQYSTWIKQKPFKVIK